MNLVPDIGAFIEARLQEDFETATAAQHGRAGEWTQDDGDHSPGLILDDSEGYGVVTYDEGSPSAEQAAHIARHDPARVLWGVAAKRWLIVDHEPGRWIESGGVKSRMCDGHEWTDYPCPLLRGLAAEWSTHPDYQEGWKPQANWPLGTEDVR